MDQGRFQAQALQVRLLHPSSRYPATWLSSLCLPEAPRPPWAQPLSWNGVSCGFTLHLPRAQACFSNLSLDAPTLQAKNTLDIFEGLLGLELLSWRLWVSLEIDAGGATVTGWGQLPQSELGYTQWMGLPAFVTALPDSELLEIRDQGSFIAMSSHSLAYSRGSINVAGWYTVVMNRDSGAKLLLFSC